MVEIFPLQYQMYVSINTSGKILICRVFTLLFYSNYLHSPELCKRPVFVHGTAAWKYRNGIWKTTILAGT